MFYFVVGFSAFIIAGCMLDIVSILKGIKYELFKLRLETYENKEK